MKLKIKVTKEILTQAAFCGLSSCDEISTNCAIALAIREIFPSGSVNHGRLYFFREAYYSKPDTNPWVELPEHAQSFVINFDGSVPLERMLMDEMSFEIPVPDSVIDSIGIEEAHRIISQSQTLELC